MNKLTILLLFFILSFLYSCEKLDPIDAITTAFDEASDKIVDQSIAWQNTLKELESKIKNDISSTIREDLTYLVQTSLASAGVEFRCNAQYLRDGLRREIRRLKNKYLASIGLAKYEVTYLPNVCHVFPNIITPTTKVVEVYGYDLLREKISVFLTSSDGKKQLINEFVNFPSHFQLTITLGGVNGLPVKPGNKKISIECESCDSQHKYISEVGFNFPSPQQIRIDAVGGLGGSVFIDEPDPLKVKRISGLRIRYGSKVDAIAIVWQHYENNWVWSTWHGGKGGIDTIISFMPNEEWIGIAGKSGSLIDQIMIQTNKRNIGPFGGTGGTPFYLLDQGQIVGIHGRSGRYLDALGLFVRR
jgi:hypothetical protein